MIYTLMLLVVRLLVIVKKNKNWHFLGRVLVRVDVHGSVHHNTNPIEMPNKMQLCRTIYYSIVP